MKILLLFFLLPTLILAAPRLRCAAAKYDFGTRINPKKITHTFTLHNAGDQPIEIAKIKNCCGVQSKITPQTILPGSNAICTAVFSTKNRYGKQIKQILVASNDPKHPYLELNFIGTLLRPIKISPRLIRLKTLYPTSTISQTITATNLLSQTIQLKSVTSTLPEISAKIIQTNDRDWKIQITSTKPLKEGKLKGHILLNFSTGAVRVFVFGSVKPALQIVPTQIQFTTSTSKPLQRLLMIQSKTGTPFKLLSATLKNTKGTVTTKQLTPTRWQCQLNIIPAEIKPNATLQLTTTSKIQPNISIPISKKQNPKHLHPK